ncbi:MAG: prepilin-type N-terminal cleavage/methylation domain-containing protein [Candidatus Saccharibacteria bacterium]|nr:prepilin-type N-terminal cleavage/methylation domain-containing protein [Candidatus Saccharibacteria bacterium]
MKHAYGFSIVELLVVIVVIAILMTIAIVGYGWMTEDARDAARRQRATEAAKAIRLLMTKKNPQYIGGLVGGSAGVPIDGSGLCQYESTHYQGGWLYDPPGPSSGGYPCDMGQMLIANGIVPKELLSTGPENDEFTASNSRITTSLMLFRCSRDPKTLVLYYHVKRPTSEETRELNRLIDPGVCGRSHTMPSRATVADRYKMKAAIEIKT